MQSPRQQQTVALPKAPTGSPRGNPATTENEQTRLLHHEHGSMAQPINEAPHGAPMQAPVQPPTGNSWRDYLPNSNMRAWAPPVVRGLSHASDVLAAGYNVANTFGGSAGRAITSGSSWAFSGATSLLSTMIGHVVPEPQADGTPTPAFSSLTTDSPTENRKRRAGAIAGGVGDVLNVAAGINGAISKGSNEQISRVSNGLWVGAGIAGAAASVESFRQAYNEDSAGRRWKMGAAVLQGVSGLANAAAGGFGLAGADSEQEHSAAYNMTSSWLWTAGAALNTAGTMAATYGKVLDQRAARAQQNQQPQPGPHNV
jgi:hypothetical protein